MTWTPWPGWTTDRHQTLLNLVVKGLIDGDPGSGGFLPDPNAVVDGLSLTGTVDPVLEG